MRVSSIPGREVIPRPRRALRHEGLRRVGRRLRRGAVLVAATLALFLPGVLEAIPAADAAAPLNIFVGYMDTHSVPSSSQQPTPWPLDDPSSYVGSPCPSYPQDTTCWDSAALRLDNPGDVDVTGVHPVVVVGSTRYDLWGTNLTVKAHGMLVLTETGAKNSENFDGSDFSPNAYNGGSTASCANSGAVPDVLVTVAGTTSSYLDTGQVLNGGGVDSGHCSNGTFVSGRMDESHPWVQIGTGQASAPAAPRSPAAAPGDGSVGLTWTAPATDGGSAVTGYDVYRGTTAGGESATPVASNVPTTSFTDTGRVNGTKYFYTIAAVNGVGVSPWSVEVSATPQANQATAPSAPTGLHATASNGSSALSWTAPTSTGGSPITGYNLYRGTTPGGEAPTPVATNIGGTSFTDTSEANGTTYYYRVAAVNAVGTSPLSNEASATPQPVVPSPPTGLAASGGDGAVALSWTVPDSDGGAGISGYDVYRGTSAGGEGAVPIATHVLLTTFTDSTAANGSTYFYRVVAVNAAGSSPRSNEASAAPHAVLKVPSPPQGLAVTGGDTTVRLSWSPPASDGGAAVTGYAVYRGTSPGGEGATAVVQGVTSTGVTDTGLVNGTRYYYTVAAVNVVGSSPTSLEVSAVPQPRPALASAFVPLVTTSPTLTLRWTFRQPGAVIDHFLVRARATSRAGASGAWQPARSAGGSAVRSWRTHLPQGATGCFEVRAVNTDGVGGGWSRPTCTHQMIDDATLRAGRGWRRATAPGAGYGTLTTSRLVAGPLWIGGIAAHRVGVVVRTCPTCGRIRLTVDGRRIGSRLTRAAAVHYRRVLWLPPTTRQTGRLVLRPASGRVFVDGVVLIP